MTARPADQTLVLVVEDEPRLRDVLVRGVREIGFPSQGVRSAEEALRVLEQDTHHILLVDLNLPGMSGLELLERVKNRWPTMTFIILTGYGDLQAAQQAIRLDASDFLTKPASLGELERALQRAWTRNAGLSTEPDIGVVSASESLGGPRTLEEIERDQILAALERNGGNRATAAVELGISVRSLYYKLAAINRTDLGEFEEPT